MSNEDRDEALTVCAEFFLLMSRSEAQGYIEQMSQNKREDLAHDIRSLMQ